MKETRIPVPPSLPATALPGVPVGWGVMGSTPISQVRDGNK